MNLNHRQLKKVVAVLIACGSVGVAQQAYGAGTPANTAINNRATVNFSVNGVAQAPIESSPTGNSVPGANNGANTTFVVDNRIDLTVTEVSGNATGTTPGQPNGVTAFTVTNTGNSAQGYQLTPTNLTGGTLFGASDVFDMANLRVFVDANGNSTYEPATDTATSINTLAPDANVIVFVVADTPITATNGQAANVRLTARTAAPGTNGATLMTETAGAETPGTVDVVFGDGTAGGNVARDGQGFADDQYLVSAATLTVAKARTVVSDPFNGTTNPKSIPGAVLEYAVTVTNSGGTAATGVVITDPVPANTTFANGTYNAGASNVQLQVGANPATFCVAEAGGTDTNTDGCVITAAGVLTVGAPALATVATGAGNAVTVRFRVTIN
ncbi:MAG TPA: hypothetical protein P5528_15380 [Steroidobacteraceae bacterium]|nr:hypothetical protein [Steroidobacteraceae bacterium]